MVWFCVKDFDTDRVYRPLSGHRLHSLSVCEAADRVETQHTQNLPARSIFECFVSSQFLICEFAQFFIEKQSCRTQNTVAIFGNNDFGLSSIHIIIIPSAVNK